MGTTSSTTAAHARAMLASLALCASSPCWRGFRDSPEATSANLPLSATASLAEIFNPKRQTKVPATAPPSHTNCPRADIADICVYAFGTRAQVSNIEIKVTDP